MEKALEHRLTKDDKCSISIIQNNGDAVTHHRYEMLSKNKTFEDYQMGIVKVRKSISEGLKVEKPDERKTHEFNRGNDERDRAKESLKEIYSLILSKRGESPQKS
jgi:hypothetical protein